MEGVNGEKGGASVIHSTMKIHFKIKLLSLTEIFTLQLHRAYLTDLFHYVPLHIFPWNVSPYNLPVILFSSAAATQFLALSQTSL